MLSHEQTMQYIALAKKGDLSAKAILIKENENLIKCLVRKFLNKGENFEDLSQIAIVGFMKAINNFDMSYGVCFSTYLVPMITGEIKRFLRDDGIIKISRVIKMQRVKINKFIEEYKEKNEGQSPSLEVISKTLEMDEGDVVIAINSSKTPLSLFEKQDDSDGDGNLELIDKIGNCDEEEKMIDRIMLRSIIESLPIRDRKIILLRFFRDKTQSETAKELGVSQVQISRLESKIISTIKNKIVNG